jgi:hypothetical protein
MLRLEVSAWWKVLLVLALPATATIRVLIQYWLDVLAGRIHVSPAGEAVA